MRISDWSSDVCSSDLNGGEFEIDLRALERGLLLLDRGFGPTRLRERVGIILLAHRLLFGERLVAIGARARGLGGRPLARQIGFGLIGARAIEPRIDLLQRLALPHDQPLGEIAVCDQQDTKIAAYGKSGSVRVECGGGGGMKKK